MGHLAFLKRGVPVGEESGNFDGIHPNSLCSGVEAVCRRETLKQVTGGLPRWNEKY